MEARLVRRPVIDLFTGRTQCLLAGNASGKRHESSYRRTKKLQNIKPESSFLFTNKSPQQDHIIFNPPSSASSVLHTPLKFLPKDDKRRAILAQSSEKQVDVTRLPPILGEPKPGYQRHHLTEKDVEEIRRLRTEEPDKWTRYKVAKKYNCSQIFVAMISEATPQQKKYEEEKLAATKARWGPKKTAAREDRAKRRQAWYQGD